jgi:hypothetical protein
MKRSDKVYEWLNREIGVRGAIGILLLTMILAYSYNKVIDRDRKASYTIGMSLGVRKESKGSRYLHYEFKVDGKFYYGSVPEGFCYETNKRFCDSGTTVFVKFQYDNPDNNTLIEKKP